jgi:hypothetical protein
VIASRGSTPSPRPRSVATPDQRSGGARQEGCTQRSDVHLFTRQGEGGRHSGRQRTCRRFRADAFGIPRFSWLAPGPASRPCCRSQSTLCGHSHSDKSWWPTPDRTAQDHALRQTVQHIGHQLDNFSSDTWYEHLDPDDTSSRHGNTDLSNIRPPDNVHVSPAVCSASYATFAPS